MFFMRAQQDGKRRQSTNEDSSWTRAKSQHNLQNYPITC